VRESVSEILDRETAGDEAGLRYSEAVVTVGRSGERRLRAVRNNRNEVVATTTWSVRRKVRSSASYDAERSKARSGGRRPNGGERYACGSETAPKGRASASTASEAGNSERRVPE